MNEEKKTEEIIIEAARDVFIEKGYDGARMAEIAAKAGINKALLHYYYRTKEKLFDLVFGQVLKNVFKEIDAAWSGDAEIETKIYKFVRSYIQILTKNPFVPYFMLNTIIRYPDKFESFIEKASPNVLTNIKMKFQIIESTIIEEAKKGNIKPVDARELVINILSLTIFPLIAKPVITTVMKFEDNEYSQVLEKRAESVTQFIMNSIKL